jgi:hypothetical protein
MSTWPQRVSAPPCAPLWSQWAVTLNKNPKSGQDLKAAKPEDRLRKYLAEQSGLQVSCEWKSAQHAFRFYFQETPEDKEWKYILDVSEEDVAADTEPRNKLEFATCLSRLKQDSGKSVPLFENGKFSSKGDKWPAPYAYRGSS